MNQYEEMNKNYFDVRTVCIYIIWRLFLRYVCPPVVVVYLCLED